MPQPPELEWAAVFGNPSGQAILTHLAERFWHRDIMYQPEMQPHDLFFREGQRSVITMLLETVEAALYHPDEVAGTYNPAEASEVENA